MTQMANRWSVYELLLDKARSRARIEEVMIGLTWTLCKATEGTGLAMSAPHATRTLPWSGTLRGQAAIEIASWITSWQPHEASVGMAALNALLNHDAALRETAEPLTGEGPANLRVFEHFLPQLQGKRVVVVGRYPGLQHYQQQFDLQVLERQAGETDLPDPASEYVIGDADWVFLTASSLTNKTFPRLAELARDTTLVLMGPTVPWVSELADFGVDFLAGVRITDDAALRQTVMEGGGTRIFETGLEYCVADIGMQTMQQHKHDIARLFAERDHLKQEMEHWYAANPARRFPDYQRLELIDHQLSALDSRYKRMWDARQINSR